MCTPSLFLLPFLQGRQFLWNSICFTGRLSPSSGRYSLIEKNLFSMERKFFSSKRETNINMAELLPETELP